MAQKISHITLVVNDYDEAINYYTQKLGFDLIEDTKLSETKRWVLVAPKRATNFSLLLARADSDEQRSRVGNQAGGRVFLFLHTTDFWTDYNKLKANGVTIVREAVTESWGTVAVFKDLYGNLWDLIESKV